MTTSVARPRRLRAQERGQLGLALRVDAAGRLVEDEQVGLGGEHRGEREPLPLAAREVARVALLEAGQPDRRERGARAPRSSPTPSATSSSARSRDEVAAGILRQVARRDRRARPRPPAGSSRPAAIFASVVLPTPFGPVSATTSPRRSSSETPSSTARVAVGEARRRSSRQTARPRAGSCGRAEPAGGSRASQRAPRRAARRARCGRPRRRGRGRSAPAARAGPLLRDDDRARRARARSSKNASAPSGSSCDVGSSSSSSRGPQRERRGEADALQLAAGELGVGRSARCAAPTAASALARRAARSPPAARRGSRARTRPRSRRASARPGPPDPGTRDATVPASSAGRAARVSRPATTTRPAKRPPWKCGTSPASARRSVDLPRARTGRAARRCSPGSTSSETSSSAARARRGTRTSGPSTGARATAPPRDEQRRAATSASRSSARPRRPRRARPRRPRRSRAPPSPRRG